MRSKRWCRLGPPSSCGAAPSPASGGRTTRRSMPNGPGTSDLDLTLVGDGPLAFFKQSGYFVPGVHSRPLSEDDPDIAPDLVPLRQNLMEMVKRPVNIQASREIVIQVARRSAGPAVPDALRKTTGPFRRTRRPTDVPSPDLQHPARWARPQPGHRERDQRLRAGPGAAAGGHRSRHPRADRRGDRHGRLALLPATVAGLPEPYAGGVLASGRGRASRVTRSSRSCQRAKRSACSAST